MVPNMTMVEVQNVGNSFITVRGISQARNSEPSVAVLVDGVLETNPYEFNQELTDIQQIEVLKGPQGALYGRNAIGGAIIIHTADPADHFEGNGKVGIGNGVSEKAQVAVSGPIDSAGTLRYRASLNFYNTDGYLENTYLDAKADPYRDYSGRLRLLWKPSDEWTADLRVFRDRVETTAYYYVIPRDDEANPFSTFTHAAEREQRHAARSRTTTWASTTATCRIPRSSSTTSADFGTFTVDHGLQPHQGNRHRRCLRFPPGQEFHRLQRRSSRAFPPPWAGRSMRARAQFIDVKTWSQELRFTSDKVGGFSWMAGAYFVHTERFISTDNLVDRGGGVPRGLSKPVGRSDQSVRERHQRHLPRRLAEQQRLGGVRRCDL